MNSIVNVGLALLLLWRKREQAGCLARVRSITDALTLWGMCVELVALCNDTNTLWNCLVLCLVDVASVSDAQVDIQVVQVELLDIVWICTTLLSHV